MKRPPRGAAVVALLALSAFAAPLSSQEYHRHMIGRPRIGIMLEGAANAEKDKLGATVRDIIPDGPAAKAGIKEGDIITKFNGTALGGAKADDDDDSGPAEKLIELSGNLDAGDTVAVEYRRGAETKTARLVAEDLPSWGRMRMRLPDMGEMPHFDYRFEGPGAHFGMMFDKRKGDLDLVDLNPDLGDYFGVKQGVLVVKTPTDSTLPLKAGDVILKIDGREPKTVSQATRILGSYDGGEVAKLEVMRKLKRLTLSWTVPQRKERSWRWKTPDGDGERVRIERT